MKLAKQLVMNKADVCGCGCHGSDPWHRSWYKRSVEVASEDALEGTVQMPYSTKPVRVTRDLGPSGRPEPCWRVDRSSIVFDKG